MGKKCVVNKDGVVHQIPPEKLQQYLEEGWKRGWGKPAWNKGLTRETDERVAKYGDSQKGKSISEEAKQKISKANKGRKLSKETLEKRIKAQTGLKRSDEFREGQRQRALGHKVSKEQIEKQKQTMLERYGGWNYPHAPSEEGIKRISEHNSSREFQEYQRNKKIENGTINTSKAEIKIKLLLEETFGKEDVIYQYNKDVRYPFACDFYIKSLDLFIELNFHWTHNFHPFDENNPEDLLELQKLMNKPQTRINSKGKEVASFYKICIEVWTKRDVIKLQTAKNNNLNYLAFYSENEFYEWFEGGATRWGTKAIDMIER